jgi:hypothetical protein
VAAAAAAAAAVVAAAAGRAMTRGTTEQRGGGCAGPKLARGRAAAAAVSRALCAGKWARDEGGGADADCARQCAPVRELVCVCVFRISCFVLCCVEFVEVITHAGSVAGKRLWPSSIVKGLLPHLPLYLQGQCSPHRPWISLVKLYHWQSEQHLGHSWSRWLRAHY